MTAASDIDQFYSNTFRFIEPGPRSCYVCAQHDPTTGEVVGIFESQQPSDTDMGSKAPKEVKVEGIWYGQLA